jgi:hypothetical protein
VLQGFFYLFVLKDWCYPMRFDAIWLQIAKNIFIAIHSLYHVLVLRQSQGCHTGRPKAIGRAGARTTLDSLVP